MSGDLIRLQRTSPNEKLVLLQGYGGIEIHTSINTLTSCGWFVTKITKRTDKTNLLLSTYTINYTLRAEALKTKCFLLNTKNFTCGACRKFT